MKLWLRVFCVYVCCVFWFYLLDFPEVFPSPFEDVANGDAQVGGGTRHVGGPEGVPAVCVCVCVCVCLCVCVCVNVS